MSKWILVINMVDGQLSRMVPDSKKRSLLLDTSEIQVVPAGIFGSAKKMWIRNIPNVNGMRMETPPDTSIPGVEPQILYILASQSPEKMQNAIISNLKMFSETAIANLNEKIQQQNMIIQNDQAVKKQLSRGVQGQLSDIRKSHDILTKDNSQKRKSRFEAPPEFEGDY